MDNLSILDTLFSGLKFKDAVYSVKENLCTVNFLYNPESFKPTDENKAVINKTLSEIIGNIVDYSLSFQACPLDRRVIANYTYTTILNNFPAISKNFTFDDISVSIDHLKVDVTLSLMPIQFEHATSMNRSDLIEEKLKESFSADFKVEFKKKTTEEANAKDTTSYIASNMELANSIKEAEEKIVYNLSNITNIIGENTSSVAIDFTKVTSVIENVVICGEVASIQRRTYKRKLTRNGETKEIDRSFYNFSIRNGGKVMYCSIFPKQSDESKGDLIEQGMKVCCYGSFREFNGKLNFNAMTVARCEYSSEEIRSSLKSVNNEYHTVIPTEYVDLEQGLLFEEENIDFPGKFVVFDLETTGLESNKDEIIEVGACKIEHGRIVEIFSSFVKPTKHIPREITNITHIDDSMVADAPTINYVLPDFHKFCYGCTMVAHNTAFDISFIYAAAKKLSYSFDNELMDTLEMSRNKLPGLKNYKLGTIVEKLGIVLENAHRAVNDAVAAAKVFIKLMTK